LKKIAIAAVLGLVLAVVPLAGAVQATTSSSATVRVIHGFPGAPNVDVWVDGAAAKTDLAAASGFDASLAAGSHAVVVCVHPSTDATCAAPSAYVANRSISVVGGDTYSLVVEPGAIGNPGVTLAQFTADGTQTALGKARFQMNHAALGAPAASVCLDGAVVPGLTGITYSQSGVAEVAEGTHNLGLSIGGAPCTTPNPVDLVAGTNFVLTVTDNQNPSCTTACVQVLVVGQARPANTPATPAFCADVLGLGSASKALSALLSPIVVGDTATYPTPAAVMTAVDGVNAVIASGDANVPAAIKPQWEILTAGLRDLTTGLALVGGDVSKLPPASLQAIVDGVNSTTPNAETAAATAVLTQFYTTSCVAAPAAAPATAAAATPAFTG
jgi:hypothetical protein